MKLKNEVLWLNWKRNQCSCNGAHLSLTGTNWRSRSSQIAGLRYKHTERQASSGSFEVLTLGLTLGNGSGTNFGASQCIPMGPWHCHWHWCCHLTLGVFIPLRTKQRLTMLHHFTSFHMWCHKLKWFCSFWMIYLDSSNQSQKQSPRHSLNHSRSNWIFYAGIWLVSYPSLHSKC